MEDVCTQLPEKQLVLCLCFLVRDPTSTDYYNCDPFQKPVEGEAEEAARADQLQRPHPRGWAREGSEDPGGRRGPGRIWEDRGGSGRIREDWGGRGGPGRTWEDRGGSRRTWEDLGGPGRTREAWGRTKED